MARTYGAEAVILKTANFGEADRLITFLSKYKGKFTAIAKGVRKIASRRGPNLALLNHVKAYFAKGKNLDVVTEVETLHTFKNAKEDLKKVSSGFHIAEVTNEFLADGQGGRAVFDLLLLHLQLLDREKNLENVSKILRTFEVKFLDLVGFKPQLRRCVSCNRIIDAENNFLSPQLGGVIDKSCASSSLFAEPISINAIKALRFLQEEDWPKIDKISIRGLLSQEIARQTRYYIEYILEKELKSVKFLEKVAQY
ncbi:MAG: DNA repair protein RecO [bacterium]|nr:DNA repair protein RecO [bacterium]